MKTISVQFQPALAKDLNVLQLKELFAAISELPTAMKYRVIEGIDGVEYINFEYATENPAELWSEISTKVYGESAFSSQLGQASIVVCEGKQGWDDYLLLHHFNPSEKLDSANEL
jgi:hypothetical protein